jgi:hypothetical protein
LEKLFIEEQYAVTRQSFIRKVPRTVMSFAIRCSTNTLATPDNMRRWGKRRISLCSNEGIIDHIQEKVVGFGCVQFVSL